MHIRAKARSMKKYRLGFYFPETTQVATMKPRAAFQDRPYLDGIRGNSNLVIEKAGNRIKPQPQGCVWGNSSYLKK